MRRLGVIRAAAALVLVLLASACGRGAPGATTATATAKTVATERDFALDKFSDPTGIDNRWFPLKPGTQLAYDGSAIEDGRRIRRQVVFTVTDLTKVVGGVRTVVAWDRDYNDGKLVEPELIFFAQDNDGNVWTLGQYPEEYEDGKLADAPTWIAGLEGAKPGIVMRAEPRVGTADYSQGLGPKVEYADRAKVHKTGHETCIFDGCYKDVLVTEEWDAAEPAARQLKYYAPGLGNVRVDWAGRDEEQEVLTLVSHTQLSPPALAQVRAEALRLERRAYAVSKEVYGRTPPAQPAPPATGQSP